VFRDVVENPADETFPGIAVVRLDGGLFFATAEAVEDRVRALAEGGEHLQALVLDLEGTNFIDSQGAAKIAELHQLAESEGFTLRLARVKPNVRAVLQADGTLDVIGADHVHGNVHRAVEAQLADDG
jgi:anti-anti-sigma factor